MRRSAVEGHRKTIVTMEYQVKILDMQLVLFHRSRTNAIFIPCDDAEDAEARFLFGRFRLGRLGMSVHSFLCLHWPSISICRHRSVHAASKDFSSNSAVALGWFDKVLWL